MAAFAVLGPADNLLLAGAVQNKFPRHFFLTQGQWVVAETGVTAHQVAERIGLDGSAGLFAVFSIAGHSGFYRKDLWEWLTINSG